MRKFIAILTTLTLMACFLMPSVSATEQDIKFNEAESFLAQLGINRGIDKDISEEISRAEFAAMVVRALNMGEAYSDNEVFADCEGHSLKAEIYTARALGITSGTSATTFSPDDGVLTEVAAKMLVSALGQAQFAEHKGGYPTGYLSIAQRLGIFKGIDASETVTVRNANIMIYNMLLADTAVISSVTNDEIISKTISGANLLSENFGFEFIEGIITTSGYDTVDPNFAGKNKIKVNEKVFSYQSDPENLIGYRCSVWYKDDVAYIISKSNKNEEIYIEAEDIISYSDYKLETMTEEGKRDSYKFDKGFTFVLNGRAIEHTAASFSFKNGALKLIDNNGDGLYDMAVCEKYEYFVISAINTQDRIIYDYNSVLESVTLSEDDSFCCEIWLNGEKVDFDSLKTDMVCRIYISEDKEVCRIKASDYVADGVVSLITEDELTVGETTYERSLYIDNLGIKINVGSSYTFLLSDEGVVVGISGSGKDKMCYAYLLGYDTGDRTLPNAKIKILTDSGDKVIFSLASKVNLNGTQMSDKDSRLREEFMNGDIPKYQMIKYKTRDEEITHIDTAVESLAEWDTDAVLDNEDSLTKAVHQTRINYRSSVSFGIPNVSFREAVIFAVPKAMTSEPDKQYDDSLFTVISSSELYNNRDYTVDAYDYNKNYVPQAITVYTNVDENTSVVPAAETTVYMLQEVRDAINEDGEQIKSLLVYGNSKYQKYLLKTDTYNTLSKNGKMPTPGDVIRLAFDRDGYISGIALDVDYNMKDDTIGVNYSDGVSESGKEYLSYFAGKVLKKSNNFMTIRTEAGPSDSITNNMTVLCLGAPKCVMFNKRTGLVTAVDISNIVSEAAGGSAAAMHVVCRTNYYSVNTIYIYTE